MRPDRLAQVRGAPVVQEEQPLSQSPQGSGAKLPPARLSLGDPVGQPRAHVVDQEVGEEIHRLIAQRGDGRVSRVERGRMAERAADGGEQLPAPRDRFDTPRRIERRRRRREEAREEGELLDRAQALDQRLGDALGGVVGDRRELAARGLVALGLKELVGDPHLDVVRLAGEQEQRLVLSLPSEPRDRAVVAVVVRLAGDRVAGENDVGPALDPEILLPGRVVGLVREDRLIGDLLDQARAEHRRGNPEDHVAARELTLEVRLRERASRRVGAAGDREEVVHAPVGRAVRVVHEPRLAHRPLGRDERRHRVGRAVRPGERDLGIHRGARSADRRVQVAAGAAVEVHRGPEAVGGFLLLLEIVLARVEERELGRGEARDGRTRARGSAAHPRIAGRRKRIVLGRNLIPEKDATGDREDQEHGDDFFHGDSFFAKNRIPLCAFFAGGSRRVNV